MKKNYFLVFIALLCSGMVIAQETQKNYINYQGVARDAERQLMANESMTLGIAIKIGNALAAPAYSENHLITTDANGVFSLKIGNGDATSGDYGDIPWGGDAAFVTVSIEGSEIGTTEMMAVPYALSSGDAKQTADQVPYNNTSSGLLATNTQEAIDALASGGTDTDTDPTNELQDISLAGTELTISNGSTIDLAPIVPPGGSDDQNLELTGDVLSIESGTGSVDLSDYINDNDADPANELQTLSFNAGTNELSLTDGGTITIPSGGTDADADPTNELQDISLAGTELSITDGATIDLAPILPPGGTDNQNLELTGDILSIEGGTGTVDLSTYRDDADADPTNEVDVTTQSGILMGDGTDVIGLSGTVDGQVLKWDATSSSWVAGTDATGVGGSSPWQESGDHIFFDTGNIGIGNSSPGVEPGAGKYLTVATGTSPSDNAFSSIEIQGGQGAGNRPIGRLDFISNSSPGNSAISRIESRTSGFAQFRGDLAFSTKDGSSFAESTLQERMTIKYDGKIGIGTINPQSSLDITGGQWDLNNSPGDFRIGGNGQGLRIGVATGIGPGGGDVRLRAQGGTNRLFIGSGNEDVMTVTSSNVAVNGDVTITGEVHAPDSGTANMIPVAYGTVDFSGNNSVGGSGNFNTSTFGTGATLIRIFGEVYSDETHTTIATLVGSPGFISVSESAGGVLEILTYDTDGLWSNKTFSFVTYKD